MTTRCWCEEIHEPGYWHDPTHGAIDRDIQEHARKLLGIPIEASVREMQHQGHSVARLAALEQSLQNTRRYTPPTESDPS